MHPLRSLFVLALIAAGGCGPATRTVDPADGAAPPTDAAADAAADATLADLPALCTQACSRQQRECGAVSPNCDAQCMALAGAPGASRCAGAITAAIACAANNPFRCMMGGAQPAEACAAAFASADACVRGAEPGDASVSPGVSVACMRYCTAGARLCGGGAEECAMRCSREITRFDDTCLAAFTALAGCVETSGGQCSGGTLTPAAACASLAARLERCGGNTAEPVPDAGPPDA
jgi:hypothetical protein